MTEVFVIERLWTDWMENNPHAAVGYAPVGFVDTEDEAKALVVAAGNADPARCWAISKYHPTPNLRYRELRRLVKP